MSKVNFMIFISLLFAITFSQLSGQDSPLNHPRKLNEKDNEIILLGYDNYNMTPSDTNSTIFFDVHFLFKNFNLTEINEISFSNFALEGIISYKPNVTIPAKFICSNSYKDNNCEKVYRSVRYTCEKELNGIYVMKKINITTNFTNEIHFNQSFITYVSSSAEAMENDLINLDYKTRSLAVLENAVLISQTPTSFKIKGEIKPFSGTAGKNNYISENIELITNVNGILKKIPCTVKKQQDKTDDQDRFFLEYQGSNSLAGVNLNSAILNYTKPFENEIRTLVLDFAEGGKNATISKPKLETKKSSGGLSTGGIVAIIIPAIIVTLGVAGLVFFLSSKPIPPPVKNMANTTLGVASSEKVIQ